MDREEFCRRVCYAVPRATNREWDGMKAELMGHMEDRMDDLTAQRQSPEEAEAEAVRRMGDPEEVGRALNRQLSQAWLVIRVAAMMGAVVMGSWPLGASGRRRNGPSRRRPWRPTPRLSASPIMSGGITAAKKRNFWRARTTPGQIMTRKSDWETMSCGFTG